MKLKLCIYFVFASAITGCATTENNPTSAQSDSCYYSNIEIQQAANQHYEMYNMARNGKDSDYERPGRLKDLGISNGNLYRRQEQERRLDAAAALGHPKAIEMQCSLGKQASPILKPLQRGLAWCVLGSEIYPEHRAKLLHNIPDTLPAPALTVLEQFQGKTCDISQAYPYPES